EEFAQQVTMALLNIYELKAHALRQLGSGNVGFGQPREIVVVEERVVGPYRFRIEQGIVKRDQAAAMAVTARGRQLQADEQVVVAPECLAVRLPARTEHALEVGSGLLGEPELARICPALFDDGRGLSPNQLGAARAETAIAAKRQFVRPAVERAVAALHRLNTERIADAKCADIYRAEQRSEIVGES